MLKFKDHVIESAIFDMDGTMFDTERLRFKTLSSAAQELFGQPFTEEVLIGSLGWSAKKAEELAKQHYGEDFPYAAIRQRADELELEHVRTHGVPIKPGLLPVPALTEPFPQAINQLKAGIHGFGAMGGGYLAQVFSHWDGYTRPAQIIASTGNALLREAITAFGKYSVRYGSHAFDQTVQHLHMVDPADEAAMIGMYRDCEIVALCLPEQASAGQADLIAQGLVARFRQHSQSLTVRVVLNKVGGAQFVHAQVEAALLRQVSPRECWRILELTDFTETVVTRIVSKLSEDALLRIKHDLYARNVAQARQATLDTEALASAVPAEHADVPTPIVSSLRDPGEPASTLAQLHLVLFNSESDIALYAQRGSEPPEHLRQVETVPDITEIQTLKNRLWNGPHAIIAWYGALLGHATVGHAMGDARVQALIEAVQTEFDRLREALELDTPPWPEPGPAGGYDAVPCALTPPPMPTSPTWRASMCSPGRRPMPGCWMRPT